MAKGTDTEWAIWLGFVLWFLYTKNQEDVRRKQIDEEYNHGQGRIVP